MGFNFIFISPNFPTIYQLFCEKMRQLPSSLQLLAISDVPFESLSPSLRGSLTEYYRVYSLEDYDQVLRAVGYFIHRYGPIDRIESHNEHWMELDARLRTDFNIPGPKVSEMPRIKRKSEMKHQFKEAGVEVVDGKRVSTVEEALEFGRTHSYPLILKPDVGVGAVDTYRIDSPSDFERLNIKEGSFVEEFVEGDIVTFDGLVDSEGEVLFYTSHQYNSGVMEIMHTNSDLYYFNQRDIPKDLVEAGHRTIKAFGIKERFFHIEYFRKKDGSLVGLEVNMRPPGGFTMDMFNIAHNIDLYSIYAEVVLYGRHELEYERPYHAFYVCQKDHISYKRRREEILQSHEFRHNIVVHRPVPPGLELMGNYYFIYRCKTLEEGQRFIDYVWERPDHELDQDTDKGKLKTGRPISK